jgi:hypothetical protein
MGTIGTLQEVWCKFFISELRDEARRVAANIANELLAGQSHIPLAGRAILHEAQMTGKTPIPADLMVRQFQNTQGGPLIGSVPPDAEC